MITPAAPIAAPAALVPPATTSGGTSFHDILSALNPLQYLPVVGTLYRAITGDVIPETVRQGGSMLVSGLMGGPIGLLANVAVTIGEKVTGIDPEKIAAAQFHTAPAPAAAPAAAPATDELSAFDVQPGTESADVLNGLELARLGKAAAAYAASQAAPIAGAPRAA